MNCKKINAIYCPFTKLTTRRNLSRYFPAFSILLCISCLITLSFFAKENETETPEFLHSRSVLSLENVSARDGTVKEVKKSSDANLPIQSQHIQEPKNASQLFQREFNSSSNDALFDQMELRRSGRKKRTFGKRPFGPFSRYHPPGDPNLKWIGYFLEEALVPVLQTHENSMVDCNVIELRNDEEQIEALKAFGSLMELAPLELPEMIQLIKLCGELPKNLIQIDDSQVYSRQTSTRNSDDPPQNFSPMILPGTLWCGLKDRAPRYENLSYKLRLDKCCRAHDHCPIKVGSFETRYGVTNYRIGTRSHCACEKEFFQCLKRVENNVADMIGNFYFDILSVECLDFPQTNKMAKYDELPRSARGLYECKAIDEKRLCRFWKKNKVKYAYKLVNLNVEY